MADLGQELGGAKKVLDRLKTVKDKCRNRRVSRTRRGRGDLDVDRRLEAFVEAEERDGTALKRIAERVVGGARSAHQDSAHLKLEKNIRGLLVDSRELWKRTNARKHITLLEICELVTIQLLCKKL